MITTIELLKLLFNLNIAEHILQINSYDFIYITAFVIILISNNAFKIRHLAFIFNFEK